MMRSQIITSSKEVFGGTPVITGVRAIVVLELAKKILLHEAVA